MNAKLDASPFFDSTPFRRAERKILKGTLRAALHPIDALQVPWDRSAKKIGQAKADAKASFREFRTRFSALRAAKGLPKATLITARDGVTASYRKANRATRKVGAWIKEHPKQALMWGPGMLGVMAVVLPVGAVEVAGISLTGLAPALASTVTDALAAHGVGATVTAANVPAILGTGTGGALASGVSSAWAHGLSMINGKDKPNMKRIIQDAGMSAGFGFLGFGVAEGMNSGAKALGLVGGGLMHTAYNWSGLMAFEMGKDYVQNGVNNLNIKIYKYHQKHGNRLGSKVLRAMRIKGIEDKDGSAKAWKDIADSAFMLETVTNTPRVLNAGWTTNFALKSVIDMGARIVWDRIIHGHPDATGTQGQHTKPGTIKTHNATAENYAPQS